MKPSRKKLLIAAVGVAAINYAASCQPITSGNLMAPDTDPTADAADDRMISSGNLVLPLVDAGPDADAADAADAATPDTGGDAGTD